MSMGPRNRILCDCYLKKPHNVAENIMNLDAIASVLQYIMCVCACELQQCTANDSNDSNNKGTYRSMG